MNRLQPIESKSNKSKLKQAITKLLDKSISEINSQIKSDGIINVYEAYKSDLIFELVKESNKSILDNRGDVLESEERGLLDNVIDKIHDESKKVLYNYTEKLGNVVDGVLKDYLEGNEYSSIVDSSKELVLTSLPEFIGEFVNTYKEYPPDIDFEEFVGNELHETIRNFSKQNNQVDNTSIDSEQAIPEENNVEEKQTKETNNVKEPDVYKQHSVKYIADNYDAADTALRELQEMVNNHNQQNPDDKIFVNVSDNATHAKIRDMRKIMGSIQKSSRLKRLAGNSIWELLKELNFDFNWIQKNQSNGIMATFYEGTIDANGMNYNNTQHFIVYYDGPEKTEANLNTRLKKIADDQNSEETLLLDDPSNGVLLLPAPKPNYYYVITADAFGKTINTDAKSIESAIDGVKELSDFSGAEKWLLNKKPNIIARDGSSIPDDGSIWDDFYKKVYEKVYTDNGNSIPEMKREKYEMTISVSDTDSGKKIYNEWHDKYKDLF